MAKIDFTNVEKSLEDALNRNFIDNLNELAALANMSHAELRAKTSDETVKKLIFRFQLELKRIKGSDIAFYTSLGLSPEQEKNFFAEKPMLNPEDWAFIKNLKEKIDTWKKTLKSPQKTTKKEANPEDLKNIEKLRKSQKDARFNVSSKWKPL